MTDRRPLRHDDVAETESVFPPYIPIDDIPSSDQKLAYPHDTTVELARLFTRFANNSRVIPVSFRKLVPWMKVGERATHYIHPYPAKLLPQIAHFFLSSKSLCPQDGLVLDPFGGTGTVALEACLSGRKTAYVDTNPLARLIASTKLWKPHDADFEKILVDVGARYRKSRTSSHPDVVNVAKWFDPPVIRGLARLRIAVEGENDAKFRQFLRVAFSATVRKVSNADLRLSVPVVLKNRAPGIKSTSFVWDRFVDQFRANVKRVSELNRMMMVEPEMEIVANDARFLTKELGGTLSSDSVDLVITSPPYAGAQKYIRASSLSLGWLNLAGTGKLKPLENVTIGREHLSKAEVIGNIQTSVNSANKVIHRISMKNTTRAAICATYLNEMELVFSQLYKVIRPGGFLILVIGNNEVCGEKFLSSEYLCEQLMNIGFLLKIKMVDEIKSRGLMTKRNRTASVITREWVMIFEKPGSLC